MKSFLLIPFLLAALGHDSVSSHAFSTSTTTTMTKKSMTRPPVVATTRKTTGSAIATFRDSLLILGYRRFDHDDEEEQQEDHSTMDASSSSSSSLSSSSSSSSQKKRNDDANGSLNTKAWNEKEIMKNQKDRILDTTRVINKNMDHDYNDEDDNNTSSDWSLEADWALMDALPKFTVGTGDQCRTFWIQLINATPILSLYTEQELTERLETLQHQRQQTRERPNFSNQPLRRLQYGPSPPVLDHWTMSMSSSSSLTNQVSGQLDNGRWIWLTAHVIGRLADDPILSQSSFGTSHSNMIANGMAGGYIEAVGGRIYELGTPKRVVAKYSSYSAITDTQSTTTVQKKDRQAQENYNKNNVASFMAWWIPATTATLTGLVASCVLSACIGYGAGLSIIQDDGSIHAAAATTTTTTATSSSSPPAVILDKKTIAPGPVAASTYATYTNQDSTTLTPQQQRERLERRIHTEQRMIQMIQDKLQTDQTELQQLN